MSDLSKNAHRLLKALHRSSETGAYAMACDGHDRPLAHELTDHGLAKWVGDNWGSQFWQITDAGRALLSNPKEPGNGTE